MSGAKDQYQTCGFRDMYMVLPKVVGVAIPDDRYPTAEAVAEALFDPCDGPDGEAVFPLGAYGLPLQPFPGKDRWDVTRAMDIETSETFDVEIFRWWVRVYLRPKLQYAKTREELEGQPLMLESVVERICAITGGKV